MKTYFMLLIFFPVLSGCGAGDFDSICLGAVKGSRNQLNGATYNSSQANQICSCMRAEFKKVTAANLEEDYVKLANNDGSVNLLSPTLITTIAGGCMMRDAGVPLQ